MKLIDKIKKLPVNKKRTFSLLTAVFLTIIIILINYTINIYWKEEKLNTSFLDKNNPVNSLKQDFQQKIDILQAVLDKNLNSQATNTDVKIDELINQINSTTSSTSTSFNIVE